jgi:hypothetical protein
MEKLSPAVKFAVAGAGAACSIYLLYTTFFSEGKRTSEQKQTKSREDGIESSRTATVAVAAKRVEGVNKDTATPASAQAEEKAKKKAKREAAAKAKKAAEEQAEEQAKKDGAAAKRSVDEGLKIEAAAAAAAAKKDADAKAKKEAEEEEKKEEKTKKELDTKMKKEAEEKAKKESDAKAEKEAEEKAKAAAAEKINFKVSTSELLKAAEEEERRENEAFEKAKQKADENAKEAEEKANKAADANAQEGDNQPLKAHSKMGTTPSNGAGAKTAETEEQKYSPKSVAPAPAPASVPAPAPAPASVPAAAVAAPAAGPVLEGDLNACMRTLLLNDEHLSTKAALKILKKARPEWKSLKKGEVGDVLLKERDIIHHEEKKAKQ